MELSFSLREVSEKSRQHVEGKVRARTRPEKTRTQIGVFGGRRLPLQGRFLSLFRGQRVENVSTPATTVHHWTDSLGELDSVAFAD